MAIAIAGIVCVGVIAVTMIVCATAITMREKDKKGDNR